MAALEFSQPPLSSKGTGTWRPRGGGPELRAEGRGGAAALSPPGRQSFRKGPEDPPGRASKGWGDPAKPARATAGGTTLPERRGKSGAQLQALFAKDKVWLARGAFPAGEAVPADERPQFFPAIGRARPRRRRRGQDDQWGAPGASGPRPRGKENRYCLPASRKEGEEAHLRPDEGEAAG